MAPIGLLAMLAITALAAMLALQAEDLRSERDRAEAQADRAQAATDLLFGVIQAADPTGERGSAATVDELLEATGRRIDAGTLGDPVLAAESLVRIADVRESMGEFDAAIDLYRRALAGIRDEVPLQSELRVSAGAGLGSALRQAGRVDEARDLLDQALASQGAAAHWKYWLSRANVAFAEGRSDQAETFLDRALAAVPEEAHPNRASSRMAEICGEAGLAADRKGDRELAREGFTRALEVQRRVLPAKHPALAGTQVNLASTMMAAGDYAGSLEPLMQAWEIHTEAAAGKPSRARAIAAVNIAYCHVQLDRLEPALRWARDALAEAEQVLQPDQWLLGHFRNVYAEALFINGRVDAARDQALAVERLYAARACRCERNS